MRDRVANGIRARFARKIFLLAWKKCAMINGGFLAIKWVLLHLLILIFSLMLKWVAKNRAIRGPGKEKAIGFGCTVISFNFIRSDWWVLDTLSNKLLLGSRNCGQFRLIMTINGWWATDETSRGFIVNHYTFTTCFTSNFLDSMLPPHL